MEMTFFIIKKNFLQNTRSFCSVRKSVRQTVDENRTLSNWHVSRLVFVQSQMQSKHEQGNFLSQSAIR